MHYGTLVIFSESPDDLTAAVEEALERGKDIHWDWWQIGGRWTGVLSGYQPETDPANIETCGLCSGTGKRPDAAQFGENWVKEMKGCNGCKGTGKATKWPTSWAQHPGDVVPVESLTQDAIDKNFAHVVCNNHGWFAGERYEPWHSDVKDMFPKLAKPPLDWIKKEYKGGVAVVVDIHN